MTTKKPLKVAYYDGAVAMGGSLMVLSHLFGAIDRSEVEPVLISAMPVEELTGLFDRRDIVWARQPPSSYVDRTRLLDRFKGRPWLSRLIAWGYTLWQPLLNLPYNAQLLWLLIRRRPDIVHINNSWLPFVLTWILRIPVVFHMHGSQSSNSRFRQRIIDRARAYVAISDFVRKTAVAQGYDGSKIHLVPNPAPQIALQETREQIRTRYNIPFDAIVLTHVGRLVAWKGQMQFLQAFKRLRDATGAPVMAAIVGGDGEGFLDQYRKSLNAFVEANGLQSSVRFIGHISEPVVFLSASDIAVHSSIDPEPFGLVITEAMAVGVPVVGANIGAPQEIIDQDKNGLLVDPHDTETFAAALKTLVDSPALREAMGRAGRDKATTVYSTQRFAESIVRIYRHTLAIR